MAKNEKNSKKGMDNDYDPLEELNEMDDNLTIETEKDYFDEIEQSDLESIPEYDSKSGKIIDTSKDDSKKVPDAEESKGKFQLMEEIDEVEFNKVNKEDSNTNSKKSLTKKVKPDKPQTTPKKGKKFNLSSKLGLGKKDKKPAVKPKKRVHTFNNNEKTLKDDTKVIDNVKVDSEGVPLLNQFDTDKIKDSELLPKITIRRFSFSKVIMIILGIIITLIGILQAMNDVVKVSDHVMYGEHESIAIGLIFLGLIIIVLAFYKELMNLAGLNNLTNMIDDVDSQSKPQPKNKKTNKK